jgi:hypothetical protein
VQCPEQRRLAELLGDTVSRYGSHSVTSDYPMLRALLMGAVYAALVPGVPMPVPVLRSELFERYELDWDMGMPPQSTTDAEARQQGQDLSRFFATEERTDERSGDRTEGRAG